MDRLRRLWRTVDNFIDEIAKLISRKQRDKYDRYLDDHLLTLAAANRDILLGETMERRRGKCWRGANRPSRACLAAPMPMDEARDSRLVEDTRPS